MDSKTDKKTKARRQSSENNKVEAPSTSKKTGIDTKAKPRSRLPFPLPELGKPGGRDDPLRQGLSGAGCRKYLRLLHEGKAPEEARRQVLEEKKKRDEETPSTASPRKNPQGKRGSEFISPPQRTGGKKQKTGNEHQKTSRPAGIAGQVTSYAKAAKLNRIGILPKEYPQVMLSPEQLTALEEAVVAEMVKTTARGLQFSGIHFRSGMVLVDCESEQTAEWLVQMSPRLKAWKGPELVARRGDDIPKSHTISIFLPRSKGQDTKALLRLIEVQNAELSTNTWRVMNAKEQGHGQVLTIGIDTKTKEAIKAKGHSIHYRFGQVPVSGLKKQDEAEEEKMDLEPAASTSSSLLKNTLTDETTSKGNEGQETEDLSLESLKVNSSSEDEVISKEDEEKLLADQSKEKQRGGQSPNRPPADPSSHN